MWWTNEKATAVLIATISAAQRVPKPIAINSEHTTSDRIANSKLVDDPMWKGSGKCAAIPEK